MAVKSETKVFLKYMRKRECWICSLCDTENEDDKCRLCGSTRLPNSIVRPAWDNMVHVQNNTDTNYTIEDSSDYDVTENYDMTEKGGNGKNVGLIIAWVVMVIILIMIIVANS